MRIITSLMVAFAGLWLFATPASASAACDGIFKTFCGVQGPEHRVDPKTLSKHEQELLRSRQRRVSGNCVYHEFAGGRAIGLPIVFAKSRAHLGCSANRLTFCTNCAAFANGHRGIGPMFGTNTAVAYSLPRNSTGVWLPSGVNLSDVAWCESPGPNVVSFSYRRFR